MCNEYWTICNELLCRTFILLERCERASNLISPNVFNLISDTYLCLPTVIDYDDAKNGGFGANTALIFVSTLPDSQILA